MFGSAAVYSGLILMLAGGALLLRRGTRRRAPAAMLAGAAVAATGFLLPARTMRVVKAQSQLDQFVPEWQFHEVHSRRIAAPPEKVYDAIKRIRADEILLFRTLTWIRRCGRELPESILNAGETEPLLEVAAASGFAWLADDSPREAVLQTEIAPPPHQTLATMNFLVRPDGSGGSYVTTETRVSCRTDAARRRFAIYWRMIYPGSALIRRMWLRAIERRATDGEGASASDQVRLASFAVLICSASVFTNVAN